MYKNYLKVAWRNLKKRPGTSFLHIGGLVVAMVIAALILLWVQNELRYDNYYPNAERISLLGHYNSKKGEYYNVSSPLPAYESIKETIPEVEQIAIAKPSKALKLLFEVNGHKFLEKEALLVDGNWPMMMGYEVLEGSLENFSSASRSIIVSKTKAKQYFGNNSPLGQTIFIDSLAYDVAAVVEDVPANSSFQQGVLVPNKIFNDRREGVGTWGSYSYITLIKLYHDGSREQAAIKINELFRKSRPGIENNMERRLIPITQVHFENDLGPTDFLNGNMLNVKVFTVLAIILLLTSCINFVNLSVARIGTRTREVGIRKIIGAEKHHLFIQVMTESVIAIVIAMFLVILMVSLLLPAFNDFVDRNLQLNLKDIYVLGALGGIFLFVFLISSIYPALLMIKLEPEGLLKNNGLKGIKNQSLSKALVAVQLTFSVFMLLSIFVVQQQFGFIQQETSAYKKDQVFQFHGNWNRLIKSGGDVLGKIHSTSNNVKNSLMSNSAIKAVSSVNGVSIVDDKLTHPLNFEWAGNSNKDNQVYSLLMNVDEDYLDLANLKLLSGRWFEEGNKRDKNNIVLNETAVKEFGLKEPVVGTKFKLKYHFENGGEIVGVVKDYHHKSLHEKIDPMVFRMDQFGGVSFLVEASSGNIPQALDHAEKVWKEYFPDYPFDYQFLDDEFDRIYKDDQRALTLTLVFGGVSVLLSCLGVLGIISVTVQQRTKEIGIRKIMGASVSSILNLLSVDFIKLVVYAMLIAFPLAWYALSRWLENFAYRIEISWWMFLLTGLMVSILVLITVRGHAMRTALLNPIKSLRDE